MNQKPKDDQKQKTPRQYRQLLQYKCPNCNAIQEVAYSGASKKIRCVDCKTEFVASWPPTRPTRPAPLTQSQKRMCCLWIGIAIFVLMGLIPPEDSGGYDFILNVSDIAFTRLFVQWVIVAVITGGLIVTFKDKKPKDEEKQ